MTNEEYKTVCWYRALDEAARALAECVQECYDDRNAKVTDALEILHLERMKAWSAVRNLIEDEPS